MKGRNKNKGFTTVELLTVVAIMALLVGVLIPAITAVRRTAKETKQKAQFATIELALMAFKNDYGDYPPSDGWNYVANSSLNYCGAQKLAEALLGWDLMGFHPDSHWQADGKNSRPYLSRGILYTPGQYFFYNSHPETGAYDMDRRKGPYLEQASASAFRLGGPEGLFINTGALTPPGGVPYPFVLCDVFSVKKITVVNPFSLKPTTYNAGTPILYFKADTSSKYLQAVPRLEPGSIYKIGDNRELIRLRRVKDGKGHPFYEPGGFSTFLEHIMDPKASTTVLWPYRPDSYILISAGADGLYGTDDDITNFEN